MADTKISGLTSLAATDVETDADVLAIVDDSATSTKKITVDNLRTAMGPKLDTEVATTSGTTKDLSPPSWAKKITLMLDQVSLDGTEEPLIQLGDSGGVEATGYLSAATRISSGALVTQASSTSGFILDSSGAAAVTLSGTVVLTLMDASNNTWTVHGVLYRSGDSVCHVSGIKSLSGSLTTVRLTSTGTPDDFDGGAVNAMYE